MSYSKTTTKISRNDPTPVVAEPREEAPLIPSQHYLFFLIASVGTAWMANGIAVISYDYWVPVIGIGYLRWDVALLCGLLELAILYTACRGNKLAVLFIVFLILGVPHIPSFLPRFHMTSLQGAGEEFFGGRIQVLEGGLTNDQSDKIAKLAMKHSADWTHASNALCLAYCQLGRSINFDFAKRKRQPYYSLSSGFRMSQDRRAREGLYRKHYPKEIEKVQAILAQHLLPVVRPVYAQALNTTEEQVIFGDEYLDGLGVPSISAMMPNVAWNWILNPHTDRKYGMVFQKMTSPDKKIDLPFFCSNSTNVQAFIMPLTAPPGAGLRQWSDPDTHSDVVYQMGKTYTFDATTVHAILPLPYKEWNRDDIRMILQTFAMACDDGRWILFH